MSELYDKTGPGFPEMTPGPHSTLGSGSPGAPGLSAAGEPRAGSYANDLGRPTVRAGADMFAPARQSRKAKTVAFQPIVPPGSVTGRSLTLVITIMCFLACLTAGAVYMINQSAAAWLRDVSSEVSVQVMPVKGSDGEKRVADIVGFIAKQPGVTNARPLSVRQSQSLLEPWLGQSEGLALLPVPRIIAIELDRADPPNIIRLGAALKDSFPGANLDDHRHWQTQIRTVTRSFALGGLTILMLVGAATTAIIVSATRSSLASNREIVEVLHFVGATDHFIAREFEKHFLRLGIKSGLLGAIFAMAVFALMPHVMSLLSGDAASATSLEFSRLVGNGALDLPGYFLLGIVVVVTAGLCMLTSRYGVFRILHSQS